VSPALIQRLPADPRELAGVRRVVRQWAHESGLSQACLDRLLLACGEALANAIEHAYPPGRPGEIELELRLSGDGFLIAEVRDFGRWKGSAARGSRGPARPGGGRGLALMNAVMDQVQVVRAPSGTTVILLDRSATSP
jgi:anti-sigma regulatory factor (Ser/Thr protein kinase)